MKRIGKRTIIFENTPVIKGYASIAGKKEYEGPLGKFFDSIIYDPYNGLETPKAVCSQKRSVLQ